MLRNDGYASGFAAATIGASGDGEHAIALLGGSIVARVAWGEPIPATASVLLVEAEGVDAATLAQAMPGIVAVAEANEQAIVATIALDQIDLVADALFCAHCIVLCAPTLAERVAALAVAARLAGVPGLVREDENDQLRRMNAEIARIAQLLARLAADNDPAGTTVDDRRRRYAVQSAADQPIDAADIRRTIRARRLRAHYVDARFVEDPGWDMLLDLFAAELERTQVSVSSLCIAAAVPTTTGLRWIARMAEAGLFVRVPDTDDRRRAFLVLSRSASDAMRGYVGAVRRAGLPIA